MIYETDKLMLCKQCNSVCEAGDAYTDASRPLRCPAPADSFPWNVCLHDLTPLTVTHVEELRSGSRAHGARVMQEQIDRQLESMGAG